MKRLYGVTTAMVTPFNESGEVELEKVAELTEFLISKGVHCLYPLGTTGEMYKLTVEERKAVAETVIRTNNKRATVFIHVGAMRQEETIELAVHAYEAGADGIGVVTPSFFNTNELELERYFIKVAQSVPEHFPVYLYNIPQCSANDLQTASIKRISEVCKNVIGIKYSYPDMLRTNEYLNVQEGFSVVQGSDRLFLPSLAMGCDGTVSGVSCVYPEPFVALYDAFTQNNLKLAREIQKIAVEYCEALRNGSNMSFFKEALKLRGVDTGFMKQPHLDLSQDEVQQLAHRLEDINERANKLFQVIV